MKELVVISGKGGTGKTSLVASFAILAGNAVLADCDVDAADLHLLLPPDVKEKHDFWSGHEAVIDRAALPRLRHLPGALPLWRDQRNSRRSG